MTNLVGPKETSGRWTVGKVAYDTEEAAQAAAKVLQDHGHGSPFVVPQEVPKFPTPWRADDGGYVYDANGVQVADTIFMGTAGFADDLARLIADAVNEKYGEESPDDEPKPGDRVRVVECCPGNTKAGCTSLVGETGILKTMSDIKRVPYYVQFDDEWYETVHKVAKV